MDSELRLANLNRGRLPQVTNFANSVTNTCAIFFCHIIGECVRTPTAINRAKYPPPILYPSYTLTSPFNTQRVINTVKTKTS